MSDTMKTLVPIAVAVIAFGVIIVGLADSNSDAPTPEERTTALASAIKCPFCNGESLQDSGSGVAADYRLLIEQRVAAGATDEEILEEFAENFGDAFILDTSTSGWSVALWAIPIAALIGGVVAILAMFQRSRAEPGTRP